MIHTGRHFLQIPGPSNVPDRVLRAMAAPTIDHRGPEFAALTRDVLDGLRPLFGTSGPIVLYPSSGSGAWEAALVNTTAPGDRVLCAETGQFATLWRDMAVNLGLDVDFLPGDWRRGVDPDAVRERLAADTGHTIRAVMVVHNETSTSVASRVPEVRAAIDAAGHPALLLVDTVSSLGCMPYDHDGWGVDVTVCGSQKGLMLPPGLGFNAISEKALATAGNVDRARSYWDWAPVIDANKAGSYPYTPATNLLYGMRESLAIMNEEGLPAIFARHERHAAATRAAVGGWGLELQCADEREYSPTLTTVRMPGGSGADELRRIILEKFDMSLGAGLGPLADQVFRIGHLGYFNDLMLAGTLAGVQMGLRLAGVPIKDGGLNTALELLEAE